MSPRILQLNRIFASLAVLMLVALGDSSVAQEAKFLSSASPKLRQFLAAHTAAFRTFTNVWSESLAGRTFWPFYFYSQNEAAPKAYHNYPGKSQVAIYIRENQETLDEFICLIFEMRNSTNEKEFAELWDKAKAGLVTRHGFALGVCELEFRAMKKTRDLLKDIKLSRRDKDNSHSYKYLKDMPEEFDHYLVYMKGLNLKRDVIKGYEVEYDRLGTKIPSPVSVAQGTNLPSMASPKLRQFLQKNPATLRILTNVLSQTFSGRALSLYYFYSDEESASKTYHDFPDESHVAVYVRENQGPLDEFICLLIEAWNASHEKRYAELWDKAKSGTISRNEFCHEVGSLEFLSAKSARDLLKDIKLSRGDRNKSLYYKRLIGVPDGFDDYLAYEKRQVPSVGVIEHLSTTYDRLCASADQTSKRTAE